MNYFFDLDNTLLKHNIYTTDFWIKNIGAKTAKEFGIKITKNKWKKIFEGEIHINKLIKNQNIETKKFWSKLNKADLEIRKKLLKNPNDIELFEDVQVIKNLSGKKAIISNTAQESIIFCLKHFGIHNYFDIIIGNNGKNIDKMKPFPDSILEAIKILGIKKNDVIFVGDEIRDLKAGKAAGVKTIIINRNGNKIDFGDLKPDRIIRSLKELL